MNVWLVILARIMLNRIMKSLLVSACLGVLSTVLAAANSPDCHTAVGANVEVDAGEFSLADLLASDTCPALLRAAAHVHLGNAPAVGSLRVLQGSQVRARLEQTAWSFNIGAIQWDRQMPERITVRRSGARASCAEIGGQVLVALRKPPADSPRETDCGAAGRISQNTPLEFARPVWNSAIRGWDVLARCVHSVDCVPFLVRVRLQNPYADLAGSNAADASAILHRASSPLRPPGHPAPEPTARHPLVRRGESVSLIWDQDGIRLVAPVISLDPGNPGQGVRARIARGGRIVPAVVESAGVLRTAS